MAKNDFKVIGQASRLPFRVAASATRGYVGEPMVVIPTYTSGVSNVNTIVVGTDGMPTIATDQFVGILAKDMDVNLSSTVIAQRVNVDVPHPNITRIRGAVKTSSTADTESEAIGLLFDIYHWYLTSSVYTWEPASADTKGFVARWYDVATASLDCVADHRIMHRVDVS